MPEKDSYIVECPHCGHSGGDVSAFEISLADECFCPQCGEGFEVGDDEDELDEDGDDDK